MPAFRKRPVVVEAVQFTGSNLFECLRFMGEPRDVVDNLELKATDAPIVHTLEGDMRTSPGDWIIRGVAGEFYPCKPEIFTATYEEVTEHGLEMGGLAGVGRTALPPCPHGRSYFGTCPHCSGVDDAVHAESTSPDSPSVQDVVPVAELSAPAPLTREQRALLYDVACRDTLGEGYGDAIRKLVAMLDQPFVVTVKGDVTPEQFAKFKKLWEQQVRAQQAEPAWKTPLILDALPPRDDRQRRVLAWACDAFGVEEATSVCQLEEAIELAQAAAVPRKTVHELMIYVYDRDPGELTQEVGGVSVTLLALCAALGVSADGVESDEVRRIMSKPPEYWAARNAKKNAAGFKATT